MNDAHVGAFPESVAQLLCELGVSFHRKDSGAGFSQMGGYGTVAGADFHDEVSGADRAGLDELGGDPGHGKEMHATRSPGTGCRGHEDSTS
jgi:hypothetical protein